MDKTRTNVDEVDPLSGKTQMFVSQRWEMLNDLLRSAAEAAIDAYTQHADHGFWETVQQVEFSPDIQGKMPRTCGRYYEARHFLQLTRDLPPIAESTSRANWYMAAHLSAVVDLREAGEADFRTLKRGSFNQTPLFREIYLRASDPDASQRDPRAINRNYKLLRNLRVHRSVNVVALENRILEYDLDAGTSAPDRWFFKRITPEEHKRITEDQDNRDRDLVTPYELERFNTYNEHRTAIAVAAQLLGVLSKVIEETATRLG